MSLVEIVFSFLVSVLIIWYLYYLHCFTYWEKKGLPTVPPRFPAGNITRAICGKENLFVLVQKLYHKFKNCGYKHAGLYFFNGPVYLPIDPDLIKRILITDFEHFVDRGSYMDEKKLPLSGHLFSTRGAKWKNLRNKLLPTYSTAKLKLMYEIFIKHTEKLIERMDEIAEKQHDVNIKYVAANFTADVIASTALGIEAETLKYPNNKFSKMVSEVFNPPLWLFIKQILFEGFQNPANIIKNIHRNKKIELFFTNLIGEIITYRENSNVIRNDLMSILLEIRKKEGFTFEEILANIFIFFLAGFETSSQTIAYCIHELAQNQHLQDKLRSEIYDNLGNNFTNFTYEEVLKLPYLDKVFNETLRLYPVLGTLNRICVKPYKVPGTDITIEKGTPVLISTLGLQRDPEFFPDPLRFDPERFDKDNFSSNYLPFGQGPRICIGKRYGILQTKLGIAALISKFCFSPSAVTPKTIEYDKLATSLIMTPLKGITVKIEKL